MILQADSAICMKRKVELKDEKNKRGNSLL